MPATQQARFDAAASGGWVVGGLAAVPNGEIAGRSMPRLGGPDRSAAARSPATRLPPTKHRHPDVRDQAAVVVIEAGFAEPFDYQRAES